MIADIPKRDAIIPSKELDTTRFWVKHELEAKYLPALPDLIEEQLFMQGRTAWNYRYSDLNVDQLEASKRITFNTFVLLKKEFHQFLDQHRFCFKATSIYYPNAHKIKIMRIHAVE